MRIKVTQTPLLHTGEYMVRRSDIIEVQGRDGMTIYGVNAKGEIVWEGKTQKTACWCVPSDTKLFVFLYTNKGRRYTIVYDPEDYLPPLFFVNTTDSPNDMRRLFQRAGIPADSEILRRLLQWMYGYGGDECAG